MIDNPLPNQIMQQKEAEELCSDHGVWDQFRNSFKEWYHSFYSDKPEEMPNVIDAQDVDLINTWWDEEADLYDDYDIPFDVDPTPQYLYDDTGGEPPISAQERAWNSFDSKRESHGHRYH